MQSSPSSSSGKKEKPGPTLGSSSLDQNMSNSLLRTATFSNAIKLLHSFKISVLQSTINVFIGKGS